MKVDKELLESAQKGNQESVERLLTLHKHLVVAVSRKYYLLGGERDDLVQEGMIGLYKAITTFDLTKSDSFSSYAVTLIEREMISAIRRANSHSQQFLSDSVFLDSDETLSDNASPESDLISEENTFEITKEIEEHLSPFERKVMGLYLKGYHYSDIAKVMDKSPKSIDNALSRIKKKLQFLKERL